MLDKFLRFAGTYLNEPKLEDVGIGPYEFWGIPGNDKRLVATLETSEGTFTTNATYQEAANLASAIEEEIEAHGSNTIIIREMELDEKQISARLVLIQLHWKADQLSITFRWEEA